MEKEKIVEFSISIINSSRGLVDVLNTQLEGNNCIQKYKDNELFQIELYILLVFVNYKKIEELYNNNIFGNMKGIFIDTYKYNLSGQGGVYRNRLEEYIERFNEVKVLLELVDISFIKYFLVNFDEKGSKNLEAIVEFIHFLAPIIESINSLTKIFINDNYGLDEEK